MDSAKPANASGLRPRASLPARTAARDEDTTSKLLALERERR